jgi:ParB-like chromosome segregation protein Spo0J
MYQVMPPLSDAEFQELKADIAARGVMVPVEYDEDGNILDGHHREQACKELGIADWPRIVRHGLDDAGKRLHARQLNLARRHLDREQKRRLIEDQLRETPQRSNRAIAASLGVDDTTVGDARRRLEATAGIPQLERTLGADGKYRPTGYRYIDGSADGQRRAGGRQRDPCREGRGAPGRAYRAHCEYEQGQRPARARASLSDHSRGSAVAL